VTVDLKLPDPFIAWAQGHEISCLGDHPSEERPEGTKIYQCSCGWTVLCELGDAGWLKMKHDHRTMVAPWTVGEIAYLIDAHSLELMLYRVMYVNEEGRASFAFRRYDKPEDSWRPYGGGVPVDGDQFYRCDFPFIRRIYKTLIPRHIEAWQKKVDEARAMVDHYLDRYNAIDKMKDPT
jgi:hypothetical protein